MALIKSHSNYVLKSKHQNVSDGTIWERDITTIGGVNQFSPGQIPIYRSNNFIISVRNDGKVSNQFNRPKWYENTEGSIWTLENVNEMASSFKEDNDVKIVLKQDYYDFNDFAYYGSLSELFRASINDIITRFPGELYLSPYNPNIYYSSRGKETIGEYYNDKEVKLLGDDDKLKMVSNPYGINIHSLAVPKKENRFKYFAEEGYKNYIVIINDNEIEEKKIVSWTVTNLADTCIVGDKICDINITYENDAEEGDEVETVEISIEAWLSINSKVDYLYSGSTNFHIRPKEEFISEFFNECDNFEKILLNRKTTPKYKAIFSVIDDNKGGYYRKMEEFIFPTSYGGYNLDASSYGFNAYTTRLSEIGEYYDEFFTDNLYRSMTHEAIKNFDWTFTREFYEGQEEEYVLGGERIQKALRIFAREFDEIKSYIDNISNYNRITYDERSNVPDYFLTDMVGNDGWDVKLVMPYDLKEVYLDDRSDVGKTAYTRDFQLNNSTYEWDEEFTTKSNEKYFVRQFSQVSDKEVTPYSKDKLPQGVRDGYFVVCGEGDITEGVPCGYGDSYHFKRTDENNKFTYVDNDSKNPETQFKYRIKSYTDERPYTYFEANKEFLRRLKVNSPYIWRHKGTIEGIEMILGMFGLKSRRWVEANSNCKYSNKNDYDYDIVEYSSFTNRIEEQWDAAHQMYRIDWFNSTKTITYDYRLVSKYNNGVDEYSYMSYQGIPVAYRDEYEYSDDFASMATNYSPYIKIGSIGSQESTSDKLAAFKEISKNNAPVKRRYLYPQFNKDEQLDGNPYFQMDGGWLSKTIGSDNMIYNFQFDIDDNIVYTKKIFTGRTEQNTNTIIDDRPLFKETVRNIRMVDGINDLLSIPKLELYNGIIIYVARIDKDIATIGNTVYEVKYEYNETNENKPLKYVELVKKDGFISPSFGMYFDDTIIVYGKNKNQTTGKIEGIEIELNVGYMKDGTVLKAYIFEEYDIPFICKSDENAYAVNSFSMVTTEEDDTNYFILEDVEHNDTLINKGNESWSYGWRRLKKHDCDFLKINTIENYYKGNNPHNGRMAYDSGHEYFTYFNRIFKHAHDNDLFDDRCFGESIHSDTNDSEYNDYLAEANGYGFNGLIDKEEKIKQYTPFLVSGDTKIRYFGNYKTRKHWEDGDVKIGDKTIYSAYTVDKIYIYGENQEKIHNDGIKYGNDYSGYTNAVTSYTLKDYLAETRPVIDLQNADFRLWNNDINTSIIDESTNQIMNNKRLSIIFNLKSKNWYSNSGQTEVKYLDNIVMNYLTQMLPSTVIVDVYYRDNEDAVEPDTRTVVESECVSQE